MPPKQRITREMILERSFAMFCRDGMEAVNARSVAKALNCSTQPIFSYFVGMDDLKGALEQKAKETFEAAIHAYDKNGEPLVNICVAYVRFAAEQPKLFAYLFMRPGHETDYPVLEDDERNELIQLEAAAANLPIDRAGVIAAAVVTYAHGLACAEAAGRYNFDTQYLVPRISRIREALLK
ncbi:MAG: TetR/AcrR family transcriptional regulator [Clostridia bacterium]|nr:TetR/AcrR family transcriptional regulator [Clostridia bacterium]MBQ4608852.1 TetR/AcrR family transcriptional regulator [Clostridia bacterium]MBQ7051593.1 TetR/AcrR family transcriptional regulator [Clostridia bacterium]